MEQQKFYKDDIVLLEISTGVYADVRVIEVKRSYGHVRYLVEPVAGKGQLTVQNLYSKNER